MYDLYNLCHEIRGNNVVLYKTLAIYTARNCTLYLLKKLLQSSSQNDNFVMRIHCLEILDVAYFLYSITIH